MNYSHLEALFEYYSLPAAFVVLIWFAIFLMAVYAFNDAKARGKSGWLVALMVLLLGGLTGLVVWVVFRPEKLEAQSTPSSRLPDSPSAETSSEHLGRSS